MPLAHGYLPLDHPRPMTEGVQLDYVLERQNNEVQLNALQRAVTALDKTLRLELVGERLKPFPQFNTITLGYVKVTGMGGRLAEIKGRERALKVAANGHPLPCNNPFQS